MTMIPTLRFRNDAPMRKRLWTAESMSHPAKGHIALWQEMIERYSQPGDTVLDPMAGIGTSLIAALMGRNVICLEMEHHFLLPMVRSWAKMRQSPMLGFATGDVQFLWGDARKLNVAQLWPYQELAVRFAWAPDLAVLKAIRRKYHLPLVTGRWPLPDASVGAALTSPPYEGSLVQEKSGIDADKLAHPYGPNSQFARPQSYTRPVDAIVTSPPYEGIRQDGGAMDIPTPSYTGEPNNYWHTQRDQTNIGNLRNAAYWSAMRQVYAECWRVLRPGGILALVLKGFTRTERRKTAPKHSDIGDWRHIVEVISYCTCAHIEEEHILHCLHEPCLCIGFVTARTERSESWVKGGYCDLPGQTETLLLEAGWQKHDHWRRELWSLSFWRILQKRRDPAAFDARLNYEEVLAFRKPA